MDFSKAKLPKLRRKIRAGPGSGKRHLASIEREKKKKAVSFIFLAQINVDTENLFGFDVFNRLD